MTRPSVTGDGAPSPTTAWPDPTSSTSSTAASTAAGSPSPTSGAKPTTSPASWRLVVTAPDGRIWSSNDGRPHFQEVAARRRLWRRLGWAEALHAHLPQLPAARVEIVIHLRNYKRADPQNYPGGSSLKGLLDGLVDARVVPDDRPEFLELAMPTLAPLNGGPPRFVLTITAREPGVAGAAQQGSLL